MTPKDASVDRGYEGHCIDNDAFGGLKFCVAGTKRGVTGANNKKLKRWNAIEPVIGHLKSDGRLSRNLLKGTQGNAMNAILFGPRNNLLTMIRHLALFFGLKLGGVALCWRIAALTPRSRSIAVALRGSS